MPNMVQVFITLNMLASKCWIWMLSRKCIFCWVTKLLVNIVKKFACYFLVHVWLVLYCVAYGLPVKIFAKIPVFPVHFYVYCYAHIYIYLYTHLYVFIYIVARSKRSIAPVLDSPLACHFQELHMWISMWTLAT